MLKKLVFHYKINLIVLTYDLTKLAAVQTIVAETHFEIAKVFTFLAELTRVIIGWTDS